MNTHWLGAGLAVLMGLALPMAATEPEATIGLALTAKLNCSPYLQSLGKEVLDRNDQVASARHRWEAEKARLPQTVAWPDPILSLSVFALTPETRTGSQRLQAGFKQKIPWFGKVALAEKSALWKTAIAEDRLFEAQWQVLSEAETLAIELAFIERSIEILRTEKIALDRFEKAARARYSTGGGLMQRVLRIQASISEVDRQFIQFDERRASLQGSLNALRDRAFDESFDAEALPEPREAQWILDDLLAAMESRPELRRIRHELALADNQIARSRREFRPDWSLSLGWTQVEDRKDLAGRLNPPADEGDDILWFGASLPLPLRKEKLRATVVEAEELRRSIEANLQSQRTGFRREVHDLASRYRHLFDQWTLLHEILLVQAQEGLKSAETAYTTGELDAVDLLEAELVVFEVKLGMARLRADIAIAKAKLERASMTVIDCAFNNGELVPTFAVPSSPSPESLAVPSEKES